MNPLVTTFRRPDEPASGGATAEADAQNPASPTTVGGLTLKKRAPRAAGAPGAAPAGSAPAPTLVKRAPGSAPRTGPSGPPTGGPTKNVQKRMERFSRVLPSRDPGVRMNENIRVPEIRVIDAEGQMIGVMSPREAIDIARAKEMDLIEIVPNAKPPVCKIVEFGKWKYEQQKKDKQAKKSSHQQLLKEVRFHPRTDTHDFEFKVRHARTFIEEGNKVKAYVQFKGREVTYKQFGEVLLNDFKKRMEDIAKVDQDISMMGRMMSMVLSPSGKKKAAEPKDKEPKEGKEPRAPKEKKSSTDDVAPVAQEPSDALTEPPSDALAEPPSEAPAEPTNESPE